MYSKYIFQLVNCASSSATIDSCNTLDVHHSALKASWLSCRIWCLSPHANSMNVSMRVKNLYIVFASAIGLWFVNIDGSPFFLSSIVKLFSRMLVFVLVCKTV